MKVLITAFMPFGGNTINSSEEILKHFESDNKEDIIVKLLLPVALNSGFKMIEDAVLKHNPDLILLTGLAANRCEISLEQNAKNILTKTLDVSDEIDLTSPIIIENGPEILRTKLNLEHLITTNKSSDIPSYISSDAGGYICNALYFKTMYYFKDIPSVFIHFPNLKETHESSIIKLSDGIKALNIIIKEQKTSY